MEQKRLRVAGVLVETNFSLSDSAKKNDVSESKEKQLVDTYIIY